MEAIQKKYNEFTVTLVNGKIAEKMPTARKSVMIYEHDAERLNASVKQTKTYYELAQVKSEPKVESDKAIEELREEYSELSGKKAYHGWNEEALIAKIEELKQN